MERFKTSLPRQRERPVKVSTAYAAVRTVVSNWQGRTLRIQIEGELRRAADALTFYEAELADHSPHATRLLASLREELNRRAALIT